MHARLFLMPGLLLAATPLAAQDYQLPLEWRWYVGSSVGFNIGTGPTFNAIDAALLGGGWTTRAAQCAGVSGCRGPAGFAENKGLPLTFSVRRAFGAHAQLRFFGSNVKPGTYVGTSGAYRATVRPGVTVLALQALATAGSGWLAAGPSLNLARVTSGSAVALVTTRASKPGFAVAAGFTFPRHQSLWLEVAAERRFVAAIEEPVVPVTAAPDIPAMRVPLSHNVITIGVGWRFP